jgi:hypothetical protein
MRQEGGRKEGRKEGRQERRNGGRKFLVFADVSSKITVSEIIRHAA